ncbi:chitin deacetylase 7 [Drosophila sulfurigaster albostrigata]|uniref:chitin deacetylase 7 n=1 Tax=Drosophila sulfurigaster albostrigata TaxID=89887 RepID=UPI002D2197E8|nr:chitin deacetylase 7 [Drosophila sulfurigaster albostrigata]
MKYAIVLILGVLLATTLICDGQKTKNKLKSKNKVKTTVAPQLARLDLQKAEPCSAAKCKLPDCRCSDATLPRPKFKGKEQEIPQFVTITFDDAVNAVNYAQYDLLFDGLTNPDGCPATGTFFLSHEYTDYVRVNALYNAGHEIALHSVTHGDGTDYWREADIDTIESEFGAQLQILETFAKVDPKKIQGMRLPFLQISGNKTFEAVKSLGLTYDSSWPTQQFKNPPMWPYTLDYLSVQDCQIGPCPNAELPGVWVNPMVTWTDTEGYSCSMIDACAYPPADEIDALFEWMLENFNRHYQSNRAPFGMYLHAAWFSRGRNNFAAFKKFVHHLSTYPDVYMTGISRMLEYVKKPVLGEPFKSCEVKPKTQCQAVHCNVEKTSTGEIRYMSVCDKCPIVYPWLKNPLGLNM